MPASDLEKKIGKQRMRVMVAAEVAGLAKKENL
jgi:hypothetical protein